MRKSNVISLTGVTHLGDHYRGERCMAVGAGDGVNCLVLMIKLRVGRGDYENQDILGVAKPYVPQPAWATNLVIPYPSNLE